MRPYLTITKISTLIGIILIFTVIPNIPYNLNSVIIKDSKKSLNNSFTYEDRAPIYINGNDDFHSQASNPSNNWDLGGTRDGTPNKPYIIDGYRIVGSPVDKLIEIKYTDVHFQINGCLLQGGAFGVYFDIVAFGCIFNNIITNNTVDGIYIYLGNQTEIRSNAIYKNAIRGIFYNISFHSVISHNLIYNHPDGIDIVHGYRNQICINNVYNHSQIGMRIKYSNETTVFNNTLSSNNIGIDLFYSNFNNLTANALLDPGNGLAIRLEYSHNNSISSNIINDLHAGITLGESENCIISTNMIYNCYFGIALTDSAYCIVHNNTIDDVAHGLYLIKADNNNFFYNYIYSSTGIELKESSYNLIKHNIIMKNYWGIWLFGSLISPCRNNIISCNNITSCMDYAIYIRYMFCIDNYIYLNNFVNNSYANSYASSQVRVLNAYDCGNVFYHNYWDDWDRSGSYEIDTNDPINEPAFDSFPLYEPVDIYNCRLTPSLVVYRIRLDIVLILTCIIIALFLSIFLIRKKIIQKKRKKY